MDLSSSCGLGMSSGFESNGRLNRQAGVVLRSVLIGEDLMPSVRGANATVPQGVPTFRMMARMPTLPERDVGEVQHIFRTNCTSSGK